MPHRDGHQVVAGVRHPPCQELVGDDTERVLIRALVAAFAVGLLGREVLARAEHGSRCGQRVVGVERAGDAEVGHLRGAVAVEKDVVRLHVAVDDVQAVRERKRTRDLGRQIERPVDGQGARARERRLQVFARDVLEDDELATLPFTPVDHRDDVRVSETRDRAGLAAKPLYVLGIARVVLVQDLDRHAALEHGVVRPVDARHAALADELLELVPAHDQFSDMHRHSVTAAGKAA